MSKIVRARTRTAILPVLLLTLLMVPATARAAPVLVQDFANVATLGASGWGLVNRSSAGGSSGWFQGNPGVFPAQDGTDDYIAANFLNAGAGGDISNWLLLPALTLKNGDTLAFATRANGDFPDRLEVRFSQNGASQNVGATAASVGDFTTLLLTINAGLTNMYPTAWTVYTVPLSGLAGPVSGRLAFRYFVNDTNTNADYVGIDSVVVTAVPEPVTLSLLGLGVAAACVRRCRPSNRPV